MQIEIFSIRLGEVPSVAQQDLQWRRILKGDPCAYCGDPSRDADHIHATWTGGERGWTNMTASCRRCNSSKNARTLLAFLSGENIGEDRHTKEAKRRADWQARWNAADDVERARMRRLARLDDE